MSRIGKMPVPLPQGVRCELNGGRFKATGPKGTLEAEVSTEINISVGESEVAVTRPTDKQRHRELHGLTRALINNLVEGVSKGFQKTLLLEGTGYRAAMQGANLNLTIGYSHPVLIEPPAGITFAVEGTQTIRVSGIDKQQVGQVAAEVRRKRAVEPYKGKGLRYEGEIVNRKESKKGA
ncbi:MAG: 50S ribosomal protein L6 [Candidatus Hydrogenedens sp.]|nr:50S ribosomal protein L6 [Candidatus Hydrogenedentota bacterium]NLF56912.1 50S ribosomal protein L6 [Candidatus Hydrogenedens sp.]